MRNRFELHVHPIAPFLFPQNEFLVADHELGRARLWIEVNDEILRHLRVLILERNRPAFLQQFQAFFAGKAAERVGRPVQLRASPGCS